MKFVIKGNFEFLCLLKNMLSTQRLTFAVILLTSIVGYPSYSKFHQVLPKCSKKESFSKIKESKKRLPEILNRKISNFSYSNGDYSSRDIHQLKKVDYSSVGTCDVGFVFDIFRAV